jgi:hypothetical protein
VEALARLVLDHHQLYETQERDREASLVLTGEAGDGLTE